MTKLLTIACLLTLLSCTKEKKPPPPHQDVLTAKVNGAPWIGVQFLKDAAPRQSGTYLFLDAENTNKHHITLMINKYTSAPITTSIDSTLSAATIALYDEGLGPLNSVRAISGNASITSVDKATYRDGEVVSGTFEFVTRNGYINRMPYVVTEGRFSVFIKTY